MKHDFQKILRRYFPEHADTQILNCPSCNKDDRLWYPIDSATCSGVGCYRCHLKVTRWWPKLSPKKMPGKLSDDDYLDWMYIYCFFLALKTWNRVARRTSR